jgi:hypothetical protein
MSLLKSVHGRLLSNDSPCSSAIECRWESEAAIVVVFYGVVIIVVTSVRSIVDLMAGQKLGSRTSCFAQKGQGGY